MKKDDMKRLTSLLLGVWLLFCAVLPVSANSAQKFFYGVDASGSVIAVAESPITVEKEVLTFDIADFPDAYASASGPISSVRAEYTFFNPSDYTVTARLLFPFGILPSYWWYDRDGQETDTLGYDVTVNGLPVNSRLRHSLSAPGADFDLNADLPLLQDGFADDFLSDPDFVVIGHKYRIRSAEAASCPNPCAAFDVLPNDGKEFYYIPAVRGMHTTDEGAFRLSVGLGKPDYSDTHGDVWELVVWTMGVGISPEEKLVWSVYRNGGTEDGDEVPMTVESETALEPVSFREYVLAERPADSPVSEIDWYNAAAEEFRRNMREAEGPWIYPQGWCSGLRGYLSRWYEYEITLAPGERLVNAVEAPMWPDMDYRWEPPIYNYRYLLSPAATWKEFGTLEIRLNTPFFLLESSPDGFEPSGEGYVLTLDGLPEGELEFTLSQSEAPKKEKCFFANIFSALGRWLLRFVGIAVTAAAVLAIVTVTVIAVVRSRRKKAARGDENTKK